MSVGAQVLGFKMGGSASYHGKVVEGAVLGFGRPVTLADIPASIQLVKRASYLWVGLVFILVLAIGLLCQIL